MGAAYITRKCNNVIGFQCNHDMDIIKQCHNYAEAVVGKPVDITDLQYNGVYFDDNIFDRCNLAILFRIDEHNPLGSDDIYCVNAIKCRYNGDTYDIYLLLGDSTSVKWVNVNKDDTLPDIVLGHCYTTNGSISYGLRQAGGDLKYCFNNIDNYPDSSYCDFTSTWLLCCKE